MIFVQKYFLTLVKKFWAAQIARPSRRSLHRALFSVAHSYLLAACLLSAVALTKKRALNKVKNVNKDQNCDRLNFMFVLISLENEDVFCT